MPTPEISIVIPALNEERNIALVFEKISKILNGETYEIIFVDDGSSDETAKAIETLASNHPEIRGILLSRNFGHQAALKAGIDHAIGNCVISLDCDLEHPPELLPQMLTHWRDGFEVVLTKRSNSIQLSRFKTLTSKAFYKILNLISEIPVEQGAADFRLLDKKVVSVCQSISENELFWRGLIPWLGFKSKIVFYDQAQRLHGESKYSFRKMMTLSLAGLTSFSIRPLYMSLYLGTFFATSSFVYLLYVIGIKLFTNKSVSGWASLIASILLIGGVQLLILGVMGVYLGKLFIQSKGRPQYVIRQTLPLSKTHQGLKKAG